MLNKKQKLNIRKKTKIRKKYFKERTRQKTKKREHIDEKHLQFNIFMLFYS